MVSDTFGFISSGPCSIYTMRQKELDDTKYLPSNVPIVICWHSYYSVLFYSEVWCSPECVTLLFYFSDFDRFKVCLLYTDKDPFQIVSMYSTCLILEAQCDGEIVS